MPTFKGIKDSEFRATVARTHIQVMKRMRDVFKNNPAARDEFNLISQNLLINITTQLKTSAGVAHSGKIEIKLNYPLLRSRLEELERIYAHELGHIVADRLHHANCRHDNRWKAIVTQMGYLPEKYHRLHSAA